MITGCVWIQVKGGPGTCRGEAEITSICTLYIEGRLHPRGSFRTETSVYHIISPQNQIIHINLSVPKSNGTWLN